MQGSGRYYDPEILSRIAGLELRVRRVLEGYLAGTHRSPFHGLNVEFAEHRAYAPGQALQHVDWRLWARSDRLYVKLFEEETNVRAYFFMDGSGSMAYGSGAMSKYDYGATAAASLAGLLLMRQDAVGLTVPGAEGLHELQPSATPGQLRAFCGLLARHVPQGGAAFGPQLHGAAERLHRRSLVVVVSDFLGQMGDSVSALRRLRYDGHAVVVVHVVDVAEAEFPFDGLVAFEGMESDGSVRTDARQVRAGYLRGFHEFGRRLREGCLETGAEYVRARTDRAVSVTLAGMLSRHGIRA
jgi:uncharacterized protein (DUF58 family)